MVLGFGQGDALGRHQLDGLWGAVSPGHLYGFHQRSADVADHQTAGGLGGRVEAENGQDAFDDLDIVDGLVVITAPLFSKVVVLHATQRLLVDPGAAQLGLERLEKQLMKLVVATVSPPGQKRPCASQPGPTPGGIGLSVYTTMPPGLSSTLRSSTRRAPSPPRPGPAGLPSGRPDTRATGGRGLALGDQGVKLDERLLAAAMDGETAQVRLRCHQRLPIARHQSLRPDWYRRLRCHPAVDG